MGLQIPTGGLTVQIADGGSGLQVQVEALRVRLDLWPTWLETGCAQTELARQAAQQLLGQSVLADEEKARLLAQELQGGLVALAAFAFAVDGFYDTVKLELGRHPQEAAWKKNRTARAAQVTETLRYRFQLGPGFTAQLRQYVDELFRFRARAVHPDGQWVVPNYRPELDSAVHPHLVTFSAPHAVQARALTLQVLTQLIARAKQLARPDADTGWIKRGSDELDRLNRLYRIPGDDQPAYPTAPL